MHSGGGTVRNSKRLLIGVFVTWAVCAAPAIPQAAEKPRLNWTSADAPCANYNDLLKPVLGNIGFRLDAAEPWAGAFRWALSFWNTVLAVNFHEDTDLNTCALRIIEGGPDILDHTVVARSQIPDWADFRGQIAVSPEAAKHMSRSEMYGTAVHEIGHMLGLKHNPSCRSVMYFLNVNGSEALDRKDISELRQHHQLRPAIAATGFRPILVIQSDSASKPEPRAVDRAFVN
jgi:hypothetical protein